MSCGAAPSCTVGYSESEGITIGFTATTDFGMEHFITAGFMVQMTWNTGTDYHCGGEAGDTVCIWYKTAHTAYTVNQFFKSRCDGTSWLGDPWVLISPNQDNDGGGQYCVVGTCRHMGSAYWDYDGPAGAPGA